ncbi:MAG: aldo/keto reductase [Methanobrevibacter sp.]|uniref:aldo/keto reductase n=1 Tax=Methanobrevibacter sp. TaxID=66852 RepID=UPI0025DA3B3F|nr:aldo/keto reductase [Methanobrevibacter sp.]MBR0270711.1 aldo/keto reductase [Methanobrevibacter sp.]
MKDVILGFGAMRLPQTDENNPASIDMEEFTKMVDYYMDQGFDYFDTSYAYHAEMSEDALKKVLVERYPRKSFRIADKIPTWLLAKEEDNERLLDIMLERLGVDYLDVLLIHNINRVFMELAESAKSFEFIKKAKDEGKALKIGISFHDKADLLEEVLEKYGDIIDIVQLQLNYLDWNDQRIQSNKCNKLCSKYGVEVIVMEPIKGGTLVNVADCVKQQFDDYSDTSMAEWALRFAGSQKNVSVVLSGMGSLDQMKENCETFKDFEEITRDEHRFLMKMAHEIKKTTAIDCSFCNYCVKECEANIPIPDYFNLYNSEKIYSLESNHALYGTTSITYAPSSACTECGTCVDYCTQQLDIPKLLKDVVDLFE